MLTPVSAFTMDMGEGAGGPAGGLAVDVMAFPLIAVDLRGTTHPAEPQLPYQQRGQSQHLPCLEDSGRETRITGTGSGNDSSGWRRDVFLFGSWGSGGGLCPERIWQTGTWGSARCLGGPGMHFLVTGDTGT